VGTRHSLDREVPQPAVICEPTEEHLRHEVVFRRHGWHKRIVRPLLAGYSNRDRGEIAKRPSSKDGAK
jgi:hypothetical protein